MEKRSAWSSWLCLSCVFSCLQIDCKIWESRDHTVWSLTCWGILLFSLFFNLGNSLKLRPLEDRIQKCCDHKISAKSLITAFQIRSMSWVRHSTMPEDSDWLDLSESRGKSLSGSVVVRILPMNWMSTDDNLMNLQWTWNQIGVVHETYILNNFFIIISFVYLIYLAVPGPSCDRWDLSSGMWELVPQPGTEPGPLALGVRSLSLWTTREDPLFWNSGEHLRLEGLSH